MELLTLIANVLTIVGAAMPVLRSLYQKHRDRQ